MFCDSARLCVFGGCGRGRRRPMRTRTRTLCIRRTLCRHVFDDWYTAPIVKNSQNHWCTNRHRSTTTVPTVYQSSKTVKRQSKQQKWPLVYQSSHVYTESAEYTKPSAQPLIMLDAIVLYCIIYRAVGGSQLLCYCNHCISKFGDGRNDTITPCIQRKARRYAYAKIEYVTVRTYLSKYRIRV